MDSHVWHSAYIVTCIELQTILIRIQSKTDQIKQRQHKLESIATA